MSPAFYFSTSRTQKLLRGRIIHKVTRALGKERFLFVSVSICKSAECISKPGWNSSLVDYTPRLMNGRMHYVYITQYLLWRVAKSPSSVIGATCGHRPKNRFAFRFFWTDGRRRKCFCVFCCDNDGWRWWVDGWIRFRRRTLCHARYFPHKYIDVCMCSATNRSKLGVISEQRAKFFSIVTSLGCFRRLCTFSPSLAGSPTHPHALGIFRCGENS